MAGMCVLVGCGTDGSTPLTPLAAPPSSLAMLAFDAQDTPHIAAQSGVFRWSGGAWKIVALDGIPMPPVEIGFDESGAMLARSGGSVYRRPGANPPWELLNPTPAPRMSSLPVETSDGTYYALGDSAGDGLAPVYFRRRGETTWIATTVGTPPASRRLADGDGNLWVQIAPPGDGHLVRIHESQNEAFAARWGGGFAPTEISLSGFAGTKLYGQPNVAVQNYGAVFAWDVRSHTASVVTDGATCKEAGTRRSCSDATPTILSGQAVGPDGTAYEIRPDPFALGGVLFRLDDGAWHPVAKGIEPVATVHFDHGGTVYLVRAGEAGYVQRVTD